jgi:virginiamycin B lyase
VSTVSRIITTMVIVFLTITVVSLYEQKNMLAFGETITTHNTNSNNDTFNLSLNLHYTNILDMEGTLQANKNKNLSGVTSQIDPKKENTIIDNNNDNDSLRKFQHEFCGHNVEANSNTYVTEYVLPQPCEMPLGIALDGDAKKVWYVSTKNGKLGSYNIKENRFDQEYIIPEWSSRKDSHSFSQVWDMKVNRKTGDVWFTDEKGNAIWRFIKPSGKFEIYKIPGSSQYFGTTYPISMEFAHEDIGSNSNNGNNDDDANVVFFVGTYSESLWYANIAKLKNGTSEGISQIALPVANNFKGIDPIYITIGSLAYDSKRHDIWISVMAYSKKGYLVRYNLDTRTFNKFELPKELSSPLGMTVDPHLGDLWVTNAGTSIFYKLKSHELNDSNGNARIVKYVTSIASPRIFSNINGLSDPRNNNSDNVIDISKHAYTLPYWIKKSGGFLWFNEWEGNKISRFDSSHRMLIEYWIPSQNRLWGICSSFNNTINSISNNNENNTRQKCGIANVLQFSTESGNNDKAKRIWFTEWSENKIGKIDVSDRHLPFTVRVTYPDSNLKELTIKRGESEKFNVKVKTTGLQSSFHPKNEVDNHIIHMIVSGTFTPTGDLGNSTAYFSKNSFTIDTSKNIEEIILIFTPSADLEPGKYTLMIGAENNAVSLLKAIQLNIT